MKKIIENVEMKYLKCRVFTTIFIKNKFLFGFDLFNLSLIMLHPNTESIVIIFNVKKLI